MSSVGGSGSGPAAAVEAALLLTSAAATAVQGVSLPQAGDGGRNEAEMAGAVSDMSHVLTALQQSEGGSAGGDALSSVIHTQPHVLGGGKGRCAELLLNLLLIITLREAPHFSNTPFASKTHL